MDSSLGSVLDLLLDVSILHQSDSDFYCSDVITSSGSQSKYTVGEKKDSTLHRAYGVKLPYLRAVWAGQGLILPLEKLTHFFLGP